MPEMRSLRRSWLLALLGLVLLMGCVVDPPTPPPTLEPTPAPTALPSATATATPTHTPEPTPTETPVPSPMPTRGPEAYYKRLVLVDQDLQTMYVYQDGVLIRTIPVSTGRPDQPETITPAWEGEVGRYVGTFFSFGTYQDEGWYLFYHYGGMLIHGNPYIKEGDQKVYQELDALGTRPASHGCIRLPPDEAVWFTSWQPQGAHMIIRALTKSF
ncbi:MAG: putative L,D-transpeptidase YciB precursor [Chloroflexi bacterium ADurb.Bin180]|nr:MAG: putative L,D-transpeptidase YciB precursor [Chloroflexi bacterium ADurb.Bin180]HQJ52132.1 L,D-transpeptidase [Anaerolineae bacterium]